MGRYRTFLAYVADDRENVILGWLNEIPKPVKAKINALIRRLEIVERLDVPEVRMLHGECDGLMELRRTAGNLQYRPICCYGPGRGEVTLLAGATERGGRFVPSSMCETARARRARLTEEGRTREHDFS